MSQSVKILIVDDEELIRLNLRVLLEDEGYTVSEAANGREGLSVFDREQPDLVLVDLRMPVMDGLAMIIRLREHSPDTPVIVVSGTDMVRDAVDAVRLGAWDYIVKPVANAEEFAIIITRSLEKAQLLKENRRYREHLEDLVRERTIALRRLNRELCAIRNCNQVLMRAEDEQTLLSDICRIICDEAGYRMAWVGYAGQDDAKTVRPVAWAGVEDGYLAVADITWADTERGRGPAGTAIRSGASASINDFATDLFAVPWRENALQRGYRSSIALPLKDKHANTFGVLCIYSQEPNAFTPDEIQLLEGLAADLMFGITTVRTRIERDQAERELRESEERFAAAFHASPDLIVITMFNGTIVEVNEDYSDVLGYSRAEVLGKTTIELGIWDDPADRATFLNCLKNASQITDFETTFRRKDGSLATVLESARTIKLQGETCILSIIHDITERKRAEEALRQSEYRKTVLNRIANIFLTIPGAEMYVEVLAVVLQAMSSPFGIFGYIGETGELIIPSLTGAIWKECQVPEKSFVFPANAWGEILWGRAIRERKAFSSDGPFHIPEGHVPIKHYLTVPIIWGQDTIGLLAVANKAGGYTGTDRELLESITTYIAPILHARLQRNVQEQRRNRAEEELTKYREHLEELVTERTDALEQEIFERKHIERALQKAKDAADTANREKSVFLTNMSHELRTPLNAILGFAQLLRREADLTTTRQEKLDVILRSGEHLLKLINDVLALSKIESGQMTLHRTPVDLWELLTTLEEMLRERAAEKELQFTVVLASGVPQYIYVDETKLRQVLINLLGNAIKFTEQGSVTLEVTKKPPVFETLPGEEDGHASHLTHLTFTVSDTGIGIATEELNQIFQPFIQSEYVSQSVEGTGLGLTISRTFVRLMGGELQVTSVVGKGSCFAFELPVELAENTALPTTTASHRVLRLASHQPAFRILVVDDHPESRTFLTKLLRSTGLDVHEAQNGQEALTQVTRQPPDLIFMDIRMAVMDGYEAARHIRELGGGVSEPGNKEHDRGAHDSNPPVSEIRPPVIIALTSDVFEENRVKMLAAGCDDVLSKPVSETDIFESLHYYLGVKYIYAEGDRKIGNTQAVRRLAPDALATLPSDLLHALEQAVIRGNRHDIEGILDMIRPQNAPVAEMVARLVAEFKYKEIWNMIQTVKETEEYMEEPDDE